MPLLPSILLCQCVHARGLSSEAVAGVQQALSQSGTKVETVADLCALAACRDSRLREWTQGGSLTVLACFPRAVKALFSMAGAQEPAECLNLRTDSAAQVLARLGIAAQTTAESSVLPVLKQNDEGNPGLPVGAWFPVIDQSRCTNCLQCLSFCLFGVYGVDAQRRVRVQAPENCKTNCPACSRVCPETAILFPKHKTAPINGGEVPVSTGREGLKADISALLGGDIYAKLRERGKTGNRFSKDRDPQTALRERQACLAQLVEAGDIPPEVLANLPAPDDLRRRAAEAQERAASARRES
jgi:NAD-dependent dihydropyrimidine dehydrogenase PreA subunit